MLQNAKTRFIRQEQFQDRDVRPVKTCEFAGARSCPGKYQIAEVTELIRKLRMVVFIWLDKQQFHSFVARITSSIVVMPLSTLMKPSCCLVIIPSFFASS